jgi:hypothetical protein
MWTVVAGIGFPAALVNRTALVLSGTWLLAEVVCRMTGENLPIALYFIFDYLALLVIFTKPELCDCSPYRNLTEQVRALGRERSRSDMFIAAIFPLMWIVYVAAIGDFYRWWVLWGLVQLQFFAAGWEAFSLWREGKKVSGAKPPGLFKLGLVGHG